MKNSINRSLLLRLLLGVSCAIFLAGCVNLVASTLPIWMVVLWICAVGISACAGERTPGKGENTYADRASADGVSGSNASIGISEGALGAGFLRGDLNGDGLVNVSDVQCTVLAALDFTPEDPATDPVCMVDTALSDLNCDELRNVVDVQIVVGMALGEMVGQSGIPQPMDSDKDNVHNECDNCPEVPNTDQTDVDGDNQGDSCEEACDGNWEICCIDGDIDQCCCPEGVACNFGWFTSCGDDTCVGMDAECPKDPDPCDGNWESFCTEEGVVDEACCPEGMACNYGQLMTVCDDGSCVNFPDECEEQCDGIWESYCAEDGVVEEACCPEGMACNYGMLMTLCDDGSCVNFPDTCEEQCDGMWQTCCVDGQVDQCCCPEGMACNYGMFNDCGDGTCTGFPDECSSPKDEKPEEKMD